MAFLKRVYADAAAATPLSPRARRELVRLLPLYGNAGALHREALEAKKEIDKARAMIAEAIGAHADEIVFTASGTEANNLGVQGVLRPLLQKHKNLHAITSSIEHPSVLEPLRALEREGLSVVYLPVDREGLVGQKNLRGAITDKTVFVSLQLVNSEIGTIEPIREVSKILKKSNKKIYFHTDASQAPLWLPLSVEKLGIDLMTLDGQKIMGPKGVGVLYVRRGVSIEPIFWGGAQERGLRAGTENVPLAGAFALALTDAQKNVEDTVEKISAVRDYLWSEIKKFLPDAVLHGPFDYAQGKPSGDTRVANNLNISIPGLSGDMAVIALDAEGIAASTRSACNTGDETPSHVIQALGVSPEIAKTAIRITLLPDATHAQARRIAKTLAGIAKRYRNMVQ